VELPDIRRDLARYTMEDPFRLLAFHLMDERALERYTRSVPVNTDNNPYLEYSRELYTRPEIIDAMLFHRTSILSALEIPAGEDSVRATLARYEEAAFHLLASQAITWLEAQNPDAFSTIWRSDVEILEAFRWAPGDANLIAIAGITDADEAAFRNRIEADPLDDEGWNRLIRLYRLRGDWERLADVLSEIRGAPTDESVLTLGILKLRQGDPAGAEEQFRNLSAASSPFLRELAGTYVEIARLSAKRESGAAEPEDLAALGDLLWGAGDRDEGERVFREAIARFPDRPLPLAAFAHALERSMRIREAEPLYTAALELPIKRSDFAESVRRGAERTRMMLALRDRPVGASAVRTPDGSTVVVDPGSPETRVRLGELLLADGFADRASVEFRIAASLAPENAAAREGLGRALARRGLRGEAEEEFRRALRIEPSRESARRELDRLGD
jgi:Flp pilus assembly protein TadD